MDCVITLAIYGGDAPRFTEAPSLTVGSPGSAGGGSPEVMAFVLPGEGTTEEICNTIRKELKAE
jgi:hypothetical protein